jgi:UDP-glucuronate decarboxylase
LVDGLVRLMNVADWNQPVNLGNPNEFTIKQLADEVAKVCGAPYDSQRTIAAGRSPAAATEHSKGPELLGWQPTIQLREGLERTVAYFSQRLPHQHSRAAASPEREVEIRLEIIH